MSSSNDITLTPERAELVDWLVSNPRERCTQIELADKLGVSPRTLRDWKAREDVRKVWKARAEEIGGDPERMQRLMDAMFEQGTDPESPKQVQAAKLFAQMTGAITPAEKPEASKGEQAKALLDLPKADLEKLVAELAQRELAASER